MKKHLKTLGKFLLKLSIKKAIGFLYWRYIGEITVYGKFNGKTIVFSFKRGAIDRLYIEAGGKMANVHVVGRWASNEEFTRIHEVYDAGK